MFSKETTDELITAMAVRQSIAEHLLEKLISETDQPEKEAIQEGDYSEIQHAHLLNGGETLSENWDFDVHGEHCRFTNTITGQIIEVSLGTKESAGNLDPYFFYEFLQTTDMFNHLTTFFERPFQDMIEFFEELESLHILTHVRGVEYKLQ